MAAPAPPTAGGGGGGFVFENFARNVQLENAGAVTPAAKKTGTTIAGLIFADGVILGADTRATGGSTVCDKNCEKIHYIAPNIYCCGAGTAADTENTTALIASQLKLHRLAMGAESLVVTSLTLLKRMLFRYQGHVSAALVLGGVDHTGASLYTVYPHGSTDKLPFVTMGSGSLAAMSEMESGYRENMTRDEGVELMARAIRAGIFNDLGSGSNVDITIITRGNVEVLRNYETPNPRPFRREGGYQFPKGTTRVLKESVRMLPLIEIVAEQTVTMEQ